MFGRSLDFTVTGIFQGTSNSGTCRIHTSRHRCGDRGQRRRPALSQETRGGRRPFSNPPGRVSSNIFPASCRLATSKSSDNGFTASAGHKPAQWLEGDIADGSFDDWLGSIGHETVGGNPVETREFRNGYFYRGLSYRLDANGEPRHALSLYVSNRGVSYVFTLSVSDGELTHAIIATLNPFLDSCTYRNFTSISFDNHMSDKLMAPEA